MGVVQLEGRDLAALLDAAGTCGDLSVGDDVPHLLDAVSRLVRCDVLFWNWYRTWPVLHELALVDARTTRPAVRAPLPEWQAHLEEHPIMSGRHGPVVAVSDVLPRRQLERTWLWQEAWCPAAVRYEIGLELPHPSDEMSVLVLSRGPGRDFDERDHLVLRLLRPHVDAAMRRVTRPPPRLTPREREVMRLVRDGLTDGQVAHRLRVAEATVSKHLEHVYAKSGARSRVEAVTICAPALEVPVATIIDRGAPAASRSPQPAHR